MEGKDKAYLISMNAIPTRIQRSRQHKQVSPNGLPIVYVGRPTKYGNPFIVGEDGTIENCLKMYKDYIRTEVKRKEIKSELRGKNLSCWCKLGDPCHADILLKIANELPGEI